MHQSKNLAQFDFVKGHESNLEDSYLQFLSEIREDLQDDEEDNELLSEEFQEEFKSIIFSSFLDSYHPIKFYWLNLIDKLVDTLALIEEELDEPSDLIGVFSDSDLLGFVVEELEKETDVGDIFDHIIDLQEIQIISFYHLHISKNDWQPNGPVSYRLVSEMGENKGHLFLGDEGDHFDASEFGTEGILPIVGYFPNKKTLQILDGDKVIEINPSEGIKEVKEVILFPGFKEQTPSLEHADKVEKALSALEECCPDLYNLFRSYTKKIVPIYDEELVSFSMATLPSYSSINMDNRDFVDMTDDLIHENGHHFLNSLLEGEEEIIFEDDDKIFFSPWRRSLRPIRGLYHAVVTFYWAYRLFKELSFSEKATTFYNKEEQQKIYWRFLEEAELIRQCEPDLLRAHQQEKITDFGKLITDTILKEIKQDQSLEEQAKELLTQESLLELQKQFDEIKKARLA